MLCRRGRETLSVWTPSLRDTNHETEPMTDKPETKQTKVEDLPERDMTDESADAVKGGLSVSPVAIVPCVRTIIPCVRTIKTGGL